MRKKLLTILIITTFNIFLTSCGRSTIAVASKPEPTAETLETPTPTDPEGPSQTPPLLTAPPEEGAPIVDPNAPKAVSIQSTTVENVDVDLTILSSVMVYSEVYAMTNTPENYIGKVVRAKGTFDALTDMTTGQKYFTVLVADAASCCAQGIEFVLAGDYKYPEEYPPLGSQITVVGTFNTYEEADYTYISLYDAVLEETK